MHRSCVSPVGTTGRCQTSCPLAGSVNGLVRTIRSGGPTGPRRPICWDPGTAAAAEDRRDCRAAPRCRPSARWSESQPRSAEDRFSVSERRRRRSYRYGGISPVVTFCLMARTQGRTSWKVVSDIGPIAPGWWHCWQFFWRIGATSLVKVGPAAAPSAALAACWATTGELRTCARTRRNPSAGTAARNIPTTSLREFYCFSGPGGTAVGSGRTRNRAPAGTAQNESKMAR